MLPLPLTTLHRCAPRPAPAWPANDSAYQRCYATESSFCSEVRDENANAICAQMLLLNAEDPHKDIYLYINSPGGSVDSAC